MWKKLKDHQRYYALKMQSQGKSGDAAPDEPDSGAFDYELRDELSFLQTKDPSKLRTTTSLGGDTEFGSASMDLNLDATVSESNYSYSSSAASKKKKKEERALEAVAMAGQSFSKYLEGKTKEPLLKHIHIWQQLEKLFEELPSNDIVDLNFLFISETYKKITSNRNK